MRVFLGVVAVAGALSAGAVAAEESSYVALSPGTEWTLSGKIVAAGGSEVEITRVTTVLEPTAVREVPTGVALHHVVVQAGGKREERVECLEVRGDGVYRVGRAKAPGKRMKTLDRAELIIPLPVAVGRKWRSVTEEKGTLILDWEVVEVDPSSGLAHLRAHGAGLALGIEVPTENERWLRATGVTERELIRSTILGVTTMTTLEIAGEPGPQRQ